MLAPLLFNTYRYDLPTTTSKNFAYVDDLAMMHCTKDWKVLEEVLFQDMTTLPTYLKKWKLKLSTAKTVSAAFHLNNREANHDLNVTVEGQNIPPCAEPTYLSVKHGVSTVRNYSPCYIPLKICRTVISYLAKILFVAVRYGIFSVP